MRPLPTWRTRPAPESILGRALAAVPGYREHSAAYDGIAERYRELIDDHPPTAGQLVDSLAERVADAAVAGEDLPDIGEPIETAAQYWSGVRDEEAAVLAIAAQRVIDNAEQLQRENTDAAVAVLADELPGIMARVATASERLGAIDTAEAAVSAGMADTWQDLTDAAHAYDELREAHRALLKGQKISVGGLPINAGQLCDRFGFAANCEALDPHHRAALEDTDSRGGPSPWARLSPIEFAQWVACSGKVEPWVPTLREMEAKRSEMDEAVQAAARERSRTARRPPRPVYG